MAQRKVASPVYLQSAGRAIDGRSVLSGARAPLDSDGRVGDFWVDTTGPATIYGPRTAAGWPAGIELTGYSGWSPILAAVEADPDYKVLKVVDWVGGEGDKPAAGLYVGEDGLTADISEAADVRGPIGDVTPAATAAKLAAEAAQANAEAAQQAAEAAAGALGATPYATKSAMDMVTPTPLPAYGYVYADGAASNNGLYIYPSGGDAWVQSNAISLTAATENEVVAGVRDDVAVTPAGDAAALAPVKADFRNFTAGSGKVARDSLIPIILGDDGGIVLGFDVLERTLVGEFAAGRYADARPDAVPIEGVELADWNGFISYGQSLSLGWLGGTVLSDSQPYLNLTFLGGCKADPDDETTGITDTKPLVEDNLGPLEATGTSGGETPCSGACNEAVTRAIRDHGYSASDLVWFASSPGEDGTSIAQLSKPGTYYTRFMNYVQGAYDLAVADGKSYALQAVAWVQMEKDAQSNTSKAVYKSALNQIISDINADVKLITGQATDVHFLCYQNTYLVTDGNRDGPLLATDEVCQENPLAHMICPLYFMRYFDSTHVTVETYQRMGRYFGRALVQLFIEQRVPDGCYISNAYVVGPAGTDVVVRIHAPSGRAVIDPDLCGPIVNEGFVVRDDTGDLTVTNVRRTGDAEITMTINRELDENPVVRYGIDSFPLGPPRTKIAPLGGGSGNIRDTTIETFMIGGVAYPAFHALQCTERNINILEA
ncbi:hypothetical protein [Amorphus sp. MBR-141]